MAENALRQVIPVEGMTCASCVRRVEKAIAAVPGVTAATVNLATESADVTLDPAASGAVIAAIEKAGYAVPEETVTLDIEGMTCASCVRRVEKALAGVPGVVSATANLATNQATVTAISGVTPAALAAAVARIGYEAKPVTDRAAAGWDREAARAQEYRLLKREVAIAALLSIPVIVVEMGAHLSDSFHHALMMRFGEQPLRIFSFLLTTIVLFGPGLRFFRKGIPALWRLAPDMNSLVVVGTAAAWAYSTFATFFPEALPQGTAQVYFESAAVIVVLILFGRMMEARAKGRTSEAISKLMKLQAKTARIARDGAFVDVPVETVVAGDVVQLRPGERVPVDGEVLEGQSFVDESMISGEPVPVLKEKGAELTGGTVNGTGGLTYTVTRVGEDTVLAQIIRMVESAQGAKLPVQAMVDRVTAWFVPAVMAIALLTFAVWMIVGPEPQLSHALVNAVAVLIIACPCAMGLATPASIMTGTGRAAEMGTLFRNGEALQDLRDVTVVAVDKTGTLTEGHPVLTDVLTAEGEDRAALLALAASIEEQSEHPAARAIVDRAREEGLALQPVSGFAAEAGFGVAAEVAGRRVAIGARRYMDRLGVDSGPLSAGVQALAEKARTPLYMAVDGRLAAVFGIADPVKKTTPDAIRALHGLGLKVVMISGDVRSTAEAIGRELGIDEVVAEVLPSGKVEVIKRLKAEGARVAFVGDGINDAPALAEADVGLAVGTGTDIAIESADVVLMGGDLKGTANAIALSRATMTNIAGNLFWAFAYNVVLIPVAAGLLYPVAGITLSPMLGAGAMALSSVFVLGNALRLKRFRAVA
ncbi:heavy metal translocating P-type ATPase [Gellertiella hungarica]|uniref:P-type Cu(2+) transporter n=1 Tax=Gellertiella hungarica TaxID=1572859 RepID=A0A7W6J1E1_9HYPH|nr:heavy metal translocating P-type ATPase [Gellertiella hungarica]MBB4062952.1 Cu+-exporting ATPase [Gellertiella hungarica]